MLTLFHTFLWAMFLPLHIGVTVIKYPMAPIAVYAFQADDGKHLDPAFVWLETIDNDLCGDSGWKNEHIEPGSDPCSDWNKTQWLWRNGGNWFNYHVIGTDNDPNIGPFEPGLNVREDGYWLYREYFNIPETDKHLELFWGWGLYGNVHDLNKFTFTTRIQTNK